MEKRGKSAGAGEIDRVRGGDRQTRETDRDGSIHICADGGLGGSARGELVAEPYSLTQQRQEEMCSVEPTVHTGAKSRRVVGNAPLRSAYALPLSFVPGNRYLVGRRVPLLQLFAVRRQHVRLHGAAHEPRKQRPGLLLARLRLSPGAGARVMDVGAVISACCCCCRYRSAPRDGENVQAP